MTEADKYKAVTENDRSSDGSFFYAVRSTGIFCRPSCNSRTPLSENVEFFDSSVDAVKAGYRACKRCRPDLDSYEPVLEIAERVKSAIDTYYNKRELLSEELSGLGVTQHRMVEIFRELYGVTPGEYTDKLKLEAARSRLEGSSDSVIDIALHLGFESISAFYAFFRKHTQSAPGEYRRSHLLLNEPVNLSYYTYETALGDMSVISDGNAVRAVRFGDNTLQNTKKAADALTDRTAKQLEEYFCGKRRQFDLPLFPAGTEFQKSVWNTIAAIPYGETRSYSEVAKLSGKPGAGRAVGMASNKNPILIIVPCHRVIGSKGELVGYAGGLKIKKRILDLEKRFAADAFATE